MEPTAVVAGRTPKGLARNNYTELSYFDKPFDRAAAFMWTFLTGTCDCFDSRNLVRYSLPGEVQARFRATRHTFSRRRGRSNTRAVDLWTVERLASSAEELCDAGVRGAGYRDRGADARPRQEEYSRKPRRLPVEVVAHSISSQAVPPPCRPLPHRVVPL